MNILLINHYAGSPDMGMEFRPYYMAQEWIKAGHNVTIFASNNAHVRKKKIEIESSFKEEIIDGILYIWIKTPPYHGNGLKRILNMRSFYKQMKRNAAKISGKYKPDIVIASSTYPMDNYAAAEIARISGAKHIYEVHDLWPLSPMELGGYSAKHPFIKYLQKAEDFAYKNADTVISMLPETKPYMISRGLDIKKWHYVPNGINLAEWDRKTPIEESLRKQLEDIRNQFDFMICYTGSHGIANALHNFIEAAKTQNDKNIAFVLLGDGPEKENLQRKAEGADNIFFFDPVSKQEIPDFLEYFDATYIGLQSQSLFRFGISPNKLFDYMMAGKPVIQSINAGNDFVKEANAGISIEAENADALAEAIIELSKKEASELKSIGNNGKEYVLKHHTYNVLAKKFIDIMHNLSHE
ncbi:MAG: glycosyltransferase WbuB [Marinilabiliales bacterium]|nr:MAG: glycosyltransferase WbuB [Marinilabiliales bacterium]